VTIGQIARSVLRRRSFYVLLACFAAAVAVANSVVDLDHRWMAVPIIGGALVLGVYTSHVVGSGTTDATSEAEQNEGDGEGPP
jgi:hypothetical protein